MRWSGGLGTRGATAGATAALKQAVALRFALLGATIVTALGVHSMEAEQQPLQPPVPQGLELAAWEVRRTC